MKADPNELYSQEEFLTLLAQRTENMCVYLIRKRRGVHSEEMARRHNTPVVVENVPDYLVEIGRVPPNSVDAWRGMFAAIERGVPNGSAHVTLLSALGDPIRFWLHFNTITGADGAPAFALIFFGDITAEYRATGLRSNDIDALLQVTQKTFPEVLTLNLTRDTYRMIQYDGVTTLGSPREGRIEDVISTRLGGVAEEDRELFSSTFSMDNLQKVFLREGRESLQLVYRRPGKDGKIYWFETTAMRQHNSFNDDILVVAMSRHVDQQKAEEARLREQLRQQAEELRLTMSQIGKIVNYYDIPTSTLTMPPTEAEAKGYPHEMRGFPESFIASAPEGFPPETLETIQRVYDAIRAGEPTGSGDYHIVTPNGETWVRLEFAVIFDQENRPIRAVVATENVTTEHAQAREARQLKENERLLRLIAQHSDRTICYYDVRAQTARPWDESTCGKCQVPRLCEMFMDDLLTSGSILPESVDAVSAMFRDIHSGVPKGALKMRAKNPEGESRWYDLRYSTIFDGDGEPVSALISHLDITEQYEHELAYRRLDQSLAESKTHLGMLEVDLDTDLIEKQGGRMAPSGAHSEGQSFNEFGRQMVAMKCLEEDQSEALQFFSVEYLLAQHAQGNRRLERTWQMRFRGGVTGWVMVKVDLMDDPYTGHPKAFFRLTDVTAEKEAQLQVQHRSERDGMTGLLNRATAETLIRAKVDEKTTPGILLLLDLDDLKGINDTFGHSEGDRAIIGIAETLKAHFRESDIIGRAGGDEFIIYLPGAAENQESIAMSVTVLLRKLAGIPIGGHDEWRIHCSVGCAVLDPERHTFEELYRQADTALYHVKRSGKNNFAFYTPQMDQTDYQFKSQKLLTMQSERKFQLEELQHLLNAISSFYPLVLSVNLSSNGYYLMEEIDNGAFSKTPTFGVLDDFVSLTAGQIHPSDVAVFQKHLSRQALMQAYEQGEDSVRCYFRFRRKDEYLWTEASAIFYKNEKGDVCDFTLVRWADERSNELERLWHQKVLELAVSSAFEYICLVNTQNGQYSIFGNDKNSHAISQKGSFEEVTLGIRDALIAPEEREDYYASAKLDTIVERMRAGNGNYSYTYTLPDGARRAAFHWFEPTHSQLLMTVQRL